jgi:GTP-binding protein
MKFIDEVTVTVESGAGGPGAVSFRREKYVPFGGPDGGDGGSGGSIIFRGSPSLSTLIDLKYKPVLKAENGHAGAGRNKSGRSGKDLIVEVPFGTEVHLLEPIATAVPGLNSKNRSPSHQSESGQSESATSTDEANEEDNYLEWTDKLPANDPAENDPETEVKRKTRAGAEFPRFYSDITPDHPEVTVAKGGQGGKGNDFFKSATRQAPDYAQPGGASQGFLVKLSLKLMADVAIVGFPNAGKSSLLRSISAAKPQVGSYPFTTLTPSLGVVRVTEGAHFVAADIPGLIEGAHNGKGLGIRFLKHIERTRLLLHLVDGEALMADEQASDDSSIEEIVNRVLAINHELASFSSLLQSLPQVIVITKRDLWISRWSNAAALHERVKEALAKTKSLLQPALAVTSLSTATGDGVGDLIILAWKALAGKAD